MSRYTGKEIIFALFGLLCKFVFNNFSVSKWSS